MKKIILFIFVIVLIGCSNATENFEAPKRRRLTDNFNTIIIDSCEYITGYNRLAHKGNCEFCKERKKQEIKELIKQIKYDYKGNTNN